MKTILVLTGGPSHEAEIARQTAQRVQGILEKHFTTHLIDLSDNWQEEMESAINQHKPDFVFLAMHGSPGECGQPQTILEAKELPFNGSSATVSELCFDKLKCAAALRDASIAVSPNQPLTSPQTTPTIPGPWVVKPNQGGSSLGVSIISEKQDIPYAFQKAKPYGPIMLETFIPGDEYTVGLYDHQALDALKIKPKRDTFYSYSAKYTIGSHYTKVEDNSLHQNLLKTAENVAKVCNLKGMSRIDLIHNPKTDDIYCIDINTIPGLNVLYPRICELSNTNFEDLLMNDIKREL